MGTEEKYRQLFNTVQCGIFEYQISGGQIRFNDINAEGLKMFGYEREEFFRKETWMNEELVFEKDIPLIEKLVGTLRKTGDQGEFTYRMKRKDVTYLWVTGSLSIIGKTEDACVFQSVCINIDKLKKTEQELVLEQEKMELALEYANITIWDYDLENRMFIRQENQNHWRKQERKFDMPSKMTVDELLTYPGLHPESVEECRRFFREICKKNYTKAIIRLKDSEDEYRYIRISLRRNASENRAVGWSEDITGFVQDQRQLTEEIERQESAKSANLIAKARFNLTRNTVESYVANENVSVEHLADTYDDWCRAFYRTALTATQADELRRMMDRKTAIRSYGQGEKTSSVEYQRILRNGRQIWTRTVTRIYREPISGDVMLFLYSHDINSEKLLQEVFMRVDRSESEMLGIIYPDQDLLYIFHSKTQEPENSEMVYSENIVRFIDRAAAIEGGREKAIESFSIDTIRRRLEEDNKYSISYPVQIGGKLSQKNWNFYYLDDAKTIIVVNRSDVTEMFMQQEKQREMLESALLAAKQASSAKSNFLSRMSHEIRTPLNAILGMCTLAAQAVGNDEEIADCISKIGISGHYLLSLINDILDMSRIESGKMLLHNDKFRMDELVSSINTVIYGQAQDKKIDYETLVDRNLEEVFVGDAMKLQQVLVNILGNAVKFTGEGGKITFAIHAGAAKNEVQNIVFTVNDTGCGIKESAISRIFEPFEQEDGTITSEYGGTGLGLAICKNLTELMGGSIHCRSIVGIGSEFTVSIPLKAVPDAVKVAQKKYAFDKMHTLIVDNDLVVCESTAKTLEDIGMSAEWVCSGMEAIERVRRLKDEKRFFDYILIDWKMPEMDGIETAKRIRKIVGPDVTIIIITAYDWIAIEREAKLAGANMCISKPMFRSTLISAFQKAGSMKEEAAVKQEMVYDFTGMRILIAEDHPMNAEIARRLLENKNCTIDVVENGLRALEQFTTMPVGYYQAILMDVRMPVMDGLQAAANIRRWNKEDAKTIPIIAMTANAFDEDVEKCRTAGMNAHLSKPIDPELMYHTIQRFTNPA